MSEEGENIIKASHYHSWIMFIKSLLTNNNYPRLITYINIKLVKLCFLLRKDIFNWSHGIFNPPPLNLLSIGGPILCPKSSWKYLGFIFNWKLMFHQHIDFYSNKAISIVKYMKLLGNLLWGINPIQKCLLYRCCILPIMLYGFQLWFYNKASLLYSMKILRKMQRRATI